VTPGGTARGAAAQAAQGTAEPTGSTEPGRAARWQPRRCHIAVVRSTAMSHRGGSAPWC